MSYTYDGALSTDLNKVRFYIGDTTADAGVRPDGTNLSDEEINGLLSIEGNWQRAVAGAYEVLAGMYAGLVDLSLGPRREAFSQAADRYQRLAEVWRKKYGYSGGTGSTVGVRQPTRIDGYSQDVAADEV